MKENKYDDNRFFQEYSRNESLTAGISRCRRWETLRKLLPDFRDKRVLDLGCGYGWHCVGRYGFVELHVIQRHMAYEELETYTDSISLFEGLWEQMA